MAVCVISAIIDTDTNTIQPACMIHTTWAPCPHNGEPAATTAIETVDDPRRGGRDKALAAWALRTRQQRPLVLHHGFWSDTPTHDGIDCWCGPEVFEPNIT